MFGFLCFFKFIYLFIYFWLRWVFIAACTLSLSCGKRGLLFVEVHGFLTGVASLVAELGLQQLWRAGSVVVARTLSSCGSRALERRLSSCSVQAQLLCGMWDPPRPGLEPVFPALAGGFLTTAPPGKSLTYIYSVVSNHLDIHWSLICCLLHKTLLNLLIF